ncbi:DUF4214 domain-containing protein [Marinomonas algicola]|uniref:DUF4214 domain-containing protein n=1 Tax=Marinomonas algicola TaxID=2773454 RepID=UPI001748572A|nr:DUF4214 domain-containing protein [Marinomonas algicola]
MSYNSTQEELNASLEQTYGEVVAKAVSDLVVLPPTDPTGPAPTPVIHVAVTPEDLGTVTRSVNPQGVTETRITTKQEDDVIIIDPAALLGTGPLTIAAEEGSTKGQAFVFNGGQGVDVTFNTVERVIVGTSGSDKFTVNGDKNTTVQGGEGNDTITSSGGNDYLAGGIGSDSIQGGAGNDSVYGGSGADAVMFTGNQADYTVTQTGAQTTVTNKATGDVTQVVNAESLTFADGAVAVEQSADVKALVTLYKQMFSSSAGRKDGQADLDGLQYWADQVDNGLSLGGAVKWMLTSAESGANMAYLDMTVAADRDTAVDLLYTQLLNRDADADGKAYWTGELENGVSLDVVAQAFVESDEFATKTVADADWDFMV